MLGWFDKLKPRQISFIDLDFVYCTHPSICENFQAQILKFFSINKM